MLKSFTKNMILVIGIIIGIAGLLLWGYQKAPKVTYTDKGDGTFLGSDGKTYTKDAAGNYTVKA